LFGLFCACVTTGKYPITNISSKKISFIILIFLPNKMLLADSSIFLLFIVIEF
jgi:hypothetical protein